MRTSQVAKGLVSLLIAVFDILQASCGMGYAKLSQAIDPRLSDDHAKHA